MFSIRKSYYVLLLDAVWVDQFRCDTQTVRKDKLFPPQSFSSGHSKKPPHWDYLVICSPNFYEVASPFDFLFICALFVHALRCYNF